MSSLAKEPNPLLVLGKCNAMSGSPNQVHNDISAATLIDECLDALLYQAAEFKPLTHNAIKLIEEAKPRMGEANALFIEGVRMYTFEGIPFMLFAQAEEKGCEHPVLYYFLGECYKWGRAGVDRDASRALQYYEKAIAGGCSLGITGRFHLHHDWNVNGFHYLLDLERQGHIDGLVLNKIGEHYRFNRSYPQGGLIAKAYFQRSIDCGSARALENLSSLLNPPRGGYDRRRVVDAEVLFLIEAEAKGLGVEDDRVLHRLIETLLDVNHDTVCTLKNTREMALHYCDVLIQRRSPLGYEIKARIYDLGMGGIEEDNSRAASIREEAVSKGVATYDICYTLQNAYTFGRGVPVNGLKVVEYCEKALQVYTSDDEIYMGCRLMAEVYKKGIKPVKKDGRKAVECYERGLRLVRQLEMKAVLCDYMAKVYVRGVKPISRNGAKALECYIMGLHPELECWCNKFYCDIIDIYKAGLPPIARNRTLAAEIGRIMARGP